MIASFGFPFSKSFSVSHSDIENFFFFPFGGLCLGSNHLLLWYLTVCLCAKPLQLYLTLCHSIDCSPRVSFIHGILEARILEWAAMTSSREPSWPNDRFSTQRSPAAPALQADSWLLSHWGSPWYSSWIKTILELEGDLEIICAYYKWANWAHWGYRANWSQSLG